MGIIMILIFAGILFVSGTDFDKVKEFINNNDHEQ